MNKRQSDSRAAAANQTEEIDLNSATEEQLAGLEVLGPRKAQMVVQLRPFDSWTEVRRIPGFSAATIIDLQSGGVRLGATSGDA